MSAARIQALALHVILWLATVGAWAEEPPEGLQFETIRFVTDYSALQLDLKTIDGASGFGADYEFALGVPLGDEGFWGGKQTRWLIEAESKGFLASDGDENPIDSTVTSLKFSGHHFVANRAQFDDGVTVRQRAMQKFWRQRLAPILEKSPDELSPKEIELLQEFNLNSSARRFVVWDAHLNYEAAQRDGISDLAAGIGMAFDLSTLSPGLTNILDYPFSWLRSTPARNLASPRIYLGYDRVTGLDDTERLMLTGNTDDSIDRATAQLAWQTGVFSTALMRFRYQAYWELGAPAAVKSAGTDSVDLFEMTLSYPLPGGTSLIAKYVDGALPPTLQGDEVYSLGWSIQFE